MNIFELAATIKLDSSDFEKGLKHSESQAEKFTGGLKATTVAAGQIIAQVAQQAVSSISGIITGAVDQFAEYEQLIGGVQKIFGEAADNVIKNAGEAYKTAGMSANTYMSTVTSFSASLIQSLGDMENAELEAADLANQAIIDMGDNVNTYGSDMESVMRAYMGFSKRNFMMLDNLKLGYGGTATEMLRLVNDSKVLDHEVKKIEDVDFATMIKAIHVMQEQMGIAGTTAKEASTTISGSKSSMTAAWQDLLTALGEGDQATFSDKMAGFEEAFGTYMKNMLPRAISTIGGAGALVKGLAEALAENVSTDKFPEFASSVGTAVTGLFEGLTNVGEWLIDGLDKILTNPEITTEDAQRIGSAVGKFIGRTITKFIEDGGDILQGIAIMGVNIGKGLIDGIVEGFFGSDSKETEQVKEAVETISDATNDSIREANENAAKGQAIVAYMQTLVDKYGEAATKTQEWQEQLALLREVLPTTDLVIDKHKGGVDGLTQSLSEAITAEKDLAIAEARREAIGQYEAASIATHTKLAVARDQLALARSNIQYAKDTLSGMPAVAALAEKGLSLDDLLLTAEQRYASGGTFDLDWLSHNIGSGNYEKLSEDERGALAANLKLYAENAAKYTELNTQIDDLTEAVKLADAAYKSAQASMAAFEEKLRNAKIEIHATVSVPTLNDDTPSWEITGDEPRATGLDYVPYDNYRARLHRGEAVLTSAEATEWRKGNNGSVNYTTVADMIGASVGRALAKAGIYMDGTRVGELTTRTVAQNIRTNNNARMLAMGG